MGNCCCCKERTYDTEVITKEPKMEEEPDDDVKEGPPSRKLVIEEEEENPFEGLEKRLELREKSYSNDAAFALAIKSGDLKKLKFMIDRGFPLNLNIRDTDGMCYEAVDLAEQGGNPELMNLIREITGTTISTSSFSILSRLRKEIRAIKVYRNKPSWFFMATGRRNSSFPIHLKIGNNSEGMFVLCLVSTEKQPCRFI
eukprot:TRINITY_DN8632_c0_g2_i5.p1 TRINITY_DN8632_c0_g2~~TRINITY_DN8632_c0_g2_i5.p1  ORF type:complete len:199 (+),score=35.17 TRINITY_DN8632_c0_g2_i5:73-669(+)